jgi:MbtH protein
MTDSDDSGNQSYRVVVNGEEQYSIWFADRENPLGWRDAGFAGSKSECLAYIETVWIDMTPLSVRRHLEKHNGATSAPECDQ